MVAKVTRLSWLRLTRVVTVEKPSRPHARDDCAKIFTALLGTIKIIRLASRQLSLDGQADELGTVAVTVVAALLHQAIDGFHHFTLNAHDQAYGIGQASRVAAHGSALLSVWKSETPAFAGAVRTDHGRVGMSPKGTLTFEPAKGWQMEPIWLPAPEAVLARFAEISRDGYRDSTLWEHLGWSLFRVIAGFFFGALIVSLYQFESKLCQLWLTAQPAK